MGGRLGQLKLVTIACSAPRDDIEGCPIIQRFLRREGAEVLGLGAWFGNCAYLRAISLSRLIEPRGQTDEPFIMASLQRVFPSCSITSCSHLPYSTAQRNEYGTSTCNGDLYHNAAPNIAGVTYGPCTRP